MFYKNDCREIIITTNILIPSHILTLIPREKYYVVYKNVYSINPVKTINFVILTNDLNIYLQQCFMNIILYL